MNTARRLLAAIVASVLTMASIASAGARVDRHAADVVASSPRTLNARVPRGDDWSDARRITTLPFEDVVDTRRATTERGEPLYCGPASHTVWYQIKPRRSVTLTISTEGSDFDTAVAVLEGPVVFPGFVGCDDDALAANTSRLAVPLSPGVRYLIQVGGAGAARGTLRIRFADPRPPENDNRAEAEEIRRLPFRHEIHTGGATTRGNEPSPSCDYNALDRSVWYSFRPSRDVTVRASTGRSDHDTSMAVYRLGTQIGCAAHGVNADARAGLAFTARKGMRYLIQVNDVDGDFGTLRFTLREVEPPPNDRLARATTIAGPLPFRDEFTTLAATAGSHDRDPCQMMGRNQTVWYRYTAVEDTVLLADATEGRFVPELAVFTGDSRDHLRHVTCGLDGSIAFRAEAGETYSIQLSGLAGSAGTGIFSLSEADGPRHDAFDEAIRVPSLPATVDGDTTRASRQLDEPAPSCGIDNFFGEEYDDYDDSPDQTLWYRYVAEFNGTVRVRTVDASFDTVVAVYRGLRVDGLREVGCSDDVGNRTDDPGYVGLSSVAFDAVKGRSYWIQVTALYGRSGSFSLEFARVRPPANDDRRDAARIRRLPFRAERNTRNATRQRNEPRSECEDLFSSGTMGPTVWFRYTPARGSWLRVRMRDSNYWAFVVVWERVPDGRLVEAACEFGFGEYVYAKKGRTYLFQIGGSDGETGDLVFRLREDT